jgi:hypothetical protein
MSPLHVARTFRLRDLNTRCSADLQVREASARPPYSLATVVRSTFCIIENSRDFRGSSLAERYRSGRNGGASKASYPVRGTWVRIPPSPPT